MQYELLPLDSGRLILPAVTPESTRHAVLSSHFADDNYSLAGIVSKRSTSSPSFFFLMIRPPPRSPLFPYTTLFRSVPFVWRGSGTAACKIQPRHGWNAPRLFDQLLWVGFNRRKHATHHAARAQVPHERAGRSEEHTSELQSPCNLVCRLLLEKKNEETIGAERPVPHRMIVKCSRPAFIG